jgi:hypothetical protein
MKYFVAVLVVSFASLPACNRRESAPDAAAELAETKTRMKLSFRPISKPRQ